MDTGLRKRFINSNEEEKMMAHIYIAFVDTPGFFAALIRKFLKQRYVHVVIAVEKKIPYPLCGDWITIYCNGHSFLSEKSIYMFLLYCKAFAGKRDMCFGKTFFVCNTERLFAV